MSRVAAKAFYSKQPGDPDVGFVTPADAQSAIDVMYDDMAAADAGVRADFAAADQAVRADMAAADAGVRADFAAADQAVRADMAAADQAAAATLGNLLTALQASYGTGIPPIGTGASQVTGQHCTLAHDAANAALLVNITNTSPRLVFGGTAGNTLGSIPVTPGDTYTFLARVATDSDLGTVALGVSAFDADGVTGPVHLNGPAVPIVATPNTYTYTVTIPAGKTKVNLRITLPANAANPGKTFRVYLASLHRGVGGSFSLPGLVVPGQGAIKANNAVDLPGGDYAPNGVVAAPVGSTFLQTSGAATVTGMLSWRKTGGGTGNTGWEAEGALADTGWRNVTLANGWTGTLYLRRVGNTVEWRIYNGSGASASSDNAYALTTGFKPSSMRRFIVPPSAAAVTDAATLITAQVDDGSGLYFTARTRATGALRAGSTFTTSDPWPTSLPGAATYDVAPLPSDPEEGGPVVD